MWGAKLTRCVRAPGVRCAHPRARARAKEAFPARASVKKNKCAQTKTSSKKTQKNVFGGRACARNKFYVACFVYLSFAAAKLPAEAATCVFLKKKTQNMQTNQFFVFHENASFVLCACDLRPISFGMTSFHHMRWGCVLMMRGGELPVPADKAFPLFDRTPTAQRGEKCRTFFFFY